MTDFFFESLDEMYCLVITICWVAFRWTQMDSPKLAGTLRSGQRRNDLGGEDDLTSEQIGYEGANRG